MANRFENELGRHGMHLRRMRPRVLQVNVGKLCNLTCVHCHVNAGPGRKEIMTRETVDRILAWQDRARLPVVDLTGGAPEMNPDFRYFVRRLREIDPEATIIERCNLTILLEPAHEDLPEFLAVQRVEIVASMPCYSPENVNAQRGEGVFDGSITALQRLNRIGYGIDPAMPLHLVFNPLGDNLPGSQDELEADYKRELRAHFGIEFNRLYTITNLPVSRFASWLRHNGKYASYLEVLVGVFNPATIDGLMCRDTINVSWLGEVFDCDFNQMMNLPMGAVIRGDDTPVAEVRVEALPERRHAGGLSVIERRQECRRSVSVQYLWELDPDKLEGQPIQTAEHCFGCTAGAGSSCGGAIEASAAVA